MKRASRVPSALIAAALSLVAFAVPALPAPRAGASGAAPVAWRRADAQTEARANGWMDSFTSGWAPNLGQVADAEGRVATSVLYSASVPNARVYLTTTGISHYFLSRREEEEGPRAPGRKRDEAPETVDWARLDLDLAGARIRPELARLEEPLADQGGTNYYLPHCPDGVMNVRTYRKVTFPDIYPGIDWVVRSEPGEGVHHDFVVRAGADPARIRLEYRGATGIEVSDDLQTLRVRTALGEVREGALRCYQGDPSNPVGARFRVEGNRVSVVVDSWDRSRPLVIDPPLVWSTYYGGSNFDGPRSIYCDNANDFIYIVGYTASTNLPVLSAGGGSYFQGTTPGTTDGFIWKFTQAGVRVWATYYGGSGGDLTADCVTDAAGNVYVCGNTQSTDFPLQNRPGAYNQATLAGWNDAFILEFNASGVRQWATFYGGTTDDYATGITTDAAGKVHVCGLTSSTDLPLMNPGGGAYAQSTIASTQDAFIARFGTGGALEWATYFGGPGPAQEGDDDAWGIATSAGSVYMTGSSRSASLPTLDPGAGAYFQGTRAGDQDLYIARFTLAGVQQWTTYFGGDSTDYGDEPVVDASGNVFVCGYTVSGNVPTVDPGGGAYYQPTYGGQFDLLLLRFSATNASTWATYLGGTGPDYLMGGQGKPLTLDAQGRVYLTAFSMSGDFPVLNPGGGSFYQGTTGGSGDAILSQFSNNGTMLWSTYFGTNVPDFGTSVAIGNGGCLFATGESWDGGSLGTVNPAGGAWYQSANAGSDDGYIARFCSPNSACCSDFTCIPVSSQAQCLALGGTAFYPNQSCSTTVCTILCTICGTKFDDLNHNGAQDGGEGGLAGWTIALYYPNGTLYTTATTDANGNYCFSNIPCGPWTVGEVGQPGWVQTWPPGGTHTLSMGTGTTQNGVNFGNHACASTAPCATMPNGMAAWWSFNDGPGATTAADHAHGSPARNVALLEGGATSGAGELCLGSATDFARVPVAGQVGLDFGTGSFSIATWLHADASSASPRTIVEKRARLSSSPGDTRGWSLYLDGLQSMLEIATGAGATQVIPGPALTAGSFSHLAVSVDRGASAGHWYLNGAPEAAYDFAPVAGSVSNVADLTIGQSGGQTGLEPAFEGCIGDLALFSAPLPAAAVYKAWLPGPISWCPEYATLPAMTTFCGNAATRQVCFTISNNHATAQSYHWSLAGLPVGPGCSVAGPTQFSPASGTVVVPAGGNSGPICVTVTRPAGLSTPGASACFALTFVNDATGACRTKTGKLRADYSCWCATPAQSGVVSVPARVPAGATIGIGVGYPCDPVATLAYRLSAVWLDDDHEDPLAVSLNGLPPGTPVFGAITPGSGLGEMVEVTVSYPGGYDPAARYEIVMEGDTDGDGTLDRMCGTIVQAAYDSTELVAVPAPPAFERSVRLTTSPNPFLGRSTIGFTLAHAEPLELGVYDLGGRLVRSLARRQLEAGPHQYVWDGLDEGGRRAPAGVYFVRLDGGGKRLQAKLVKMR